MELKLKIVYAYSSGHGLLIVPYGIETFTKCLLLCWRSGLLIVPYGIETRMAGISVFLPCLLIVPYGIETDLNILILI